MTTNPSLELDIKVADALVKGLDRFDDNGWDHLGNFASGFLSGIAKEGKIPVADLEAYLEHIELMTNSIEWLDVYEFDYAESLVKATKGYLNNPSPENAHKLLEA
jgi:hypothetical protein